MEQQSASFYCAQVSPVGHRQTLGQNVRPCVLALPGRGQSGSQCWIQNTKYTVKTCKYITQIQNTALKLQNTPSPNCVCYTSPVFGSQAVLGQCQAGDVAFKAAAYGRSCVPIHIDIRKIFENPVFVKSDKRIAKYAVQWMYIVYGQGSRCSFHCSKLCWHKT